MIIKECLVVVGLSPNDLAACPTLADEYKVIKKAYFKKVLVSHPDKGGDKEVFVQLQASFEVLREIFEGDAISSFAKECDKVTDRFKHLSKEFAGMRTPAYDYYAAAAAEPVPSYRIELAKTSRGKCHQKTKLARVCPKESVILQGEVRVGSMDPLHGQFGRWVHLDCWRVASKIWMGLPDPSECSEDEVAKALEGMNEVLIEGFADLPAEKKADVIRHVMNTQHWANKIGRHTDSAAASSFSGGTAPTSTATSPGEVKISSSSSEAIVQSERRFTVLRPGVDAAIPDCLSGRTIVVTGIFPEVGGGAGLDLGKSRLKSMIASFGGRVTGSVSGKTDYLIVGKEPGASKVNAARKRGTLMLDLPQLVEVLRGNSAVLEDAAEQPMMITNYSAGYYGNAVAAITDFDYQPKKRKAAAAKPKQTAKSKKAKKEPEPKPEPVAMIADLMHVTCDTCGKDCTQKSWFVSSTEQDYCDICLPSGISAVLQCNGIDVQ